MASLMALAATACLSLWAPRHLSCLVLPKGRDTVRAGRQVSPQVPNRVVDAAKGLLNKVLPDVYVYTDHQKGASAGASPGYGVSLVAETTNGCLFGAEACGGPGQVPEDVGALAAKLLLAEVLTLPLSPPSPSFSAFGWGAGAGSSEVCAADAHSHFHYSTLLKVVSK